MKAGNQKGFTLIELVMIIVILGILAAVAVPKYVNLAGDAELSSKKAFTGTILHKIFCVLFIRPPQNRHCVPAGVLQIRLYVNSFFDAVSAN